MPPHDSGKTLKPEEIETLRQWIAEGGQYKKHWAFEPPARPAVPAVSDEAWVRNPIDAFVLARLEREGLQPSPPRAATRCCGGCRSTWWACRRRLRMWRIGKSRLAALNRKRWRDDAYEHLVERLLASPHYGERWGRLWLDAARYADSDGFEKDKPRFVWMYRDWVINALNARHAVRPVHHRADRRRPAAARDAGPARRHRVSAELDDQRRRRHRPRAVPHGSDVRPHGRHRQRRCSG